MVGPLCTLYAAAEAAVTTLVTQDQAPSQRMLLNFRRQVPAAQAMLATAAAAAAAAARHKVRAALRQQGPAAHLVVLAMMEVVQGVVAVLVGGVQGLVQETTLQPRCLNGSRWVA
jgi:hypothetical protein